MRLWGDSLEALCIASGTIFNEIIVWKVDSSPSRSSSADGVDTQYSFSITSELLFSQLKAINICRLVGHEGSIFRIAWSSSGSKLVSVSDDRSARIWELPAVGQNNSYIEEAASTRSTALVLFGHTARIWDCFLSDSLIVTAGEDCTCRVWGLDGRQLKKIKEHVGRGIWRCLYDPVSLLLVTAGFDSAIKVHQLHVSMQGGLEGHTEVKEFIDRTKKFTVSIPDAREHIGPMNSKSEYVRCLRFTCEDTLYVATNRGYIYHAKLSHDGNVSWTELIRVSDEVPVICMDLFSRNKSGLLGAAEDWIAVGDGKGSMTIVRVTADPCTPKVTLSIAWPAELERQLLGTYWCKSLGSRCVFTADPKGTLKLWRLDDQVEFVSSSLPLDQHVSLIAEFISSHGTRIMCLDASLDGEILVCGDLRGNLILFPLSKGMLLGRSTSVAKMVPQNCFKGAHGISAVSSVSITRLSFNQFEIHSTGADGCICYFKYFRDQENLEFTGMKQVKELSLVQSVFTDKNSLDNLASAKYAAGFASADFIIWNILDEAKVVQISCGGWRRPHSYYLGAIPEMRNCFAYVKDANIHIHRNWVTDSQTKLFPQNLHIQFHGREIHSLCFVSEEVQVKEKGNNSLSSRCSWIATGCEDGTVRLTRYTSNAENWSVSKLLGEHVGGSAVKSICFVSKLQIMACESVENFFMSNGQFTSTEDSENPLLLISVGAKRVVTSWLLRNRRLNMEDSLVEEHYENNGNVCKAETRIPSSISFQWLSTDMPAKYSVPHEKINEKIQALSRDISSERVDVRCSLDSAENRESGNLLGNKYDDDWRYLAVTAFLVKCLGSRVTVCFIVVACSDASVALRALILPYRLWFDVALLVPLSSPVLALQHVIVPLRMHSEDKCPSKNMYIVVGGSTDGSIAFWDLTESVETFMQRVSTLQVEKIIDCQRRPRTGRGSQGGRQWRSLSKSIYKKKSGRTANKKVGGEKSSDILDNVSSETTSNKSDTKSSTALCSQTIHTSFDELATNVHEPSSDICELWPLQVLNNLHQSGVNCLHVSEARDCSSSHNGYVYNVISGGDDQALNGVRFEVLLQPSSPGSEVLPPSTVNTMAACNSTKSFVPHSQNENVYSIRFLNHIKIASAHSSAVKGIWTDGIWVFSTGLDQRVRCWHLGKHGELDEHSHLIVSVPEPEALDARTCGRNHYLIAVVGRGMQMVEFAASCDID